MVLINVCVCLCVLVCWVLLFYVSMDPCDLMQINDDDDDESFKLHL